MVILSAPHEDQVTKFKLGDPEDLEFLKSFFSILEFSIPIRTVSYHIVGAFMTDDFTTKVMPYMHSLMGSHMSIRHRIHNGTTVPAIQASLAKYGITRLPSFLAGNDNEWKTNGTNWLNKRRYLEERAYSYISTTMSNSSLNYASHNEMKCMEDLFPPLYLF
jgi:hypothetical protein